MPDKHTNVLALTDPNRGGINIILAVFKSFSLAYNNEFDFKLAKEVFIKNICIGLNCPAFAVNQLEFSGFNCTGPKQDVMNDDNGMTMSALTEITSYDQPITRSRIKSLKCNPIMFNDF